MRRKQKNGAKFGKMVGSLEPEVRNDGGRLFDKMYRNVWNQKLFLTFKIWVGEQR
jgi:hypothetical protein